MLIRYLLLVLIGSQIIFLSSCKKEYNDYITNDYITNVYDSEYQVLQGKWFRVDSNYEEYDNMRVEVNATETTGTILSLGNSSSTTFEVGDVKWKNIIRESNDVFSIQELGSTIDFIDNVMYRSALLSFVGKDSIRVAVKGNGSWQLWIRE